jgi:hypothetical protein
MTPTDNQLVTGFCFLSSFYTLFLGSFPTVGGEDRRIPPKKATVGRFFRGYTWRATQSDNYKNSYF